MATKYDASNPEHFALFGLDNAQLRRRGLSDADIAALRKTQQQAPPATSAAELAAASEPTTRRTGPRPDEQQGA